MRCRSSARTTRSGARALGFGAPATLGTISAAAEDDCFTFTGNRGDSIEIRSVVTSGQLALNRLVARADGNFISCSNPGANRLVCVLTTTGTHTLMLGTYRRPGPPIRATMPSRSRGSTTRSAV